MYLWLQEGVDYDGIGAQDDASFPSELSEGTSEVNPAMITSVDSSCELFEENLQSPTGEKYAIENGWPKDSQPKYVYAMVNADPPCCVL